MSCRGELSPELKYFLAAISIVFRISCWESEKSREPFCRAMSLVDASMMDLMKSLRGSLLLAPASLASASLASALLAALSCGRCGIGDPWSNAGPMSNIVLRMVSCTFRSSWVRNARAGPVEP